jgi:gag-polyprotein putative aspartyl protease
MHKDRTDATALAICECRVDKMNRHFSKKDYRRNTAGNTVDISALIKEDSTIDRQMQECYENSGKTFLLQAEGFEKESIAACIKSVRDNTEKSLDTNRLAVFCSCQLNLIKVKKLTDAEIKTLSNPNSLLFYETMYKCGSPFSEKNNEDNSWDQAVEKDITGPVSDTISILTLNGMTYVKLKTGTMVQFWLFDTGASDMLISKEMEASLKNESLLTAANYLGTGEYEMANGQIDTCRRYLLNNVLIGKFTVSNITVAVSDKAKKIIVGKALLNKFSNWILDNKNNKLILNK